MLSQGQANTNEYSKYLTDISNISKGLTGALYRVTDMLSDKDPLKWDLREQALRTHTHILSISSNPNVVLDIIDGVTTLIELLDIGSSGTYISNRNFEILEKEYKKFKSAIESKEDDITNKDKLIFNNIEQLLRSDKGRNDLLKDAHMTQNYPQQLQPVSDKPATRIEELQQQSQIGRKARILEILRDGGEQTVAEIAANFDVSEKSIQRDLLALTEQKHVIAHGERRWRTYSNSVKIN